VNGDELSSIKLADGGFNVKSHRGSSKSTGSCSSRSRIANEFANSRLGAEIPRLERGRGRRSRQDILVAEKEARCLRISRLDRSEVTLELAALFDKVFAHIANVCKIS
jgi:hypothetical protein